MSLPELPLSFETARVELGDLKSMVVKRRLDWPAWFSTNPSGQVWPGVTFSYHARDQRIQLRGENALLDDLADLLVSLRPEGGRFFVNDEGASFRPEHGSVVEFAAFRFGVGSDRTKRRTVIRRVPPQGREAHEKGMCDQQTCRFCIDEQLHRQTTHIRKVSELMADQLLGVAGKRKKRWER